MSSHDINHDITHDSSDSEDEQLNIGQTEQVNQSNTDSKNKKKKNKNKNKKSTETKPKQSAVGKLALERLRLVAEEEARIKALEEEARLRALEEEAKIEAEKQRLEEEEAKKKKALQDKKQALIDSGLYKTKAQKEKDKKNKQKLDLFLNSNGCKMENGRIIVQSINSKSDGNQQTNQQTNQQANPNELKPEFKSIISCIMGHVDTGKTKLLDKIRNTNVQTGEAGGITQQIGASFIPLSTLNTKIQMINSELEKTLTLEEFKIPGLLMIDTPGHEAFKNLRLRGSSMCNIAIVVIDLVHGLEPQTIESIEILRKSNTKFIFALNKMDRLYGWKQTPDNDIIKSLGIQDENTISEFKTRLNNIIGQIMSNGLNAKLYWENDSIEDTISICPTSAITGEGIGNLLKYLIEYSQTNLISDITWSNEFKGLILDSNLVEGLGSTIDVILFNGEIKTGNKILISSTDGVIETTVRNILTPHPNTESRVSHDYQPHTQIKGSMCIKIVANNIEKAIAGTDIFLIPDKVSKIEYDRLVDLASDGIKNTSQIQLQKEGVTVHASTLGSLEALLKFLREECKPPIPVAQVHIGKIMKKNIVKTSIFNNNNNSPKEYYTILAFNVQIDDDAVEEAKNKNIKIFSAEIIYHLFDQFKIYKENLIKERKENARPYAVFPTKLKILPEFIFNKKNPIVLGVEVLEGTLHIGTPLAIPSPTPFSEIYIGKVVSIQNNGKDVQVGKTESQVCIKIENDQNPNIYFGRQFGPNDILYSKISRESIDTIKQYFREDISNSDVLLLAKFKKLFHIA